MRSAFRSALQYGLEERHDGLAIDGTAVQLRFAGADMAEPALPALAPLGCDRRSSATFTVELWDSG
jgi:hypothetical protein